ncbi:hypothetical protein I4U23_022767 [Adineta vaga]|nr:hypothetical protein I4U23_022767 [Adineta vaga]
MLSTSVVSPVQMIIDSSATTCGETLILTPADDHMKLKNDLIKKILGMTNES